MIIYTGSPYLQMEMNNMEYRFKNGHARIEHRVSPNGTPEAVIHLMPKDDEGNQSRSRTHDLYQEVSAWVKTQKIGGADVDHTILLMKHTDEPYMVAFKAVGYE